jgi:hypothetical protein
VADPRRDDDERARVTFSAESRSAPTTPERSGNVPRPSQPADARYTVGDEIARGGMGRVVQAVDSRLGRVVAMKEALRSGPEVVQRFEREIQITARLEHPSIVPVYDAGTTPDGAPFYVMRKVAGRPLEALVEDAKTLAKRLALVPHVLAAANALAHAHQRGVIHRDVKPANILVGALGETVVIDWGLAKITGESEDSPDPGESTASGDLRTRRGAVIGTPCFMSPEQLRAEAVDARSDVYALGATLYFVLARRPPHAADAVDDMMRAALAGPPRSLDRIVPGVPRELITIVDKALAYDRAARYHDAGGIAEDLRRFLEGRLVASHRYSRWERVVRVARRHRVAVTVAASATIVLAIGGALSLRKIVAERDRADALLAQTLERNDELELASAKALVATDPTLAVARVKPLVATHWRETRAIGLAARAGGVARGLPASQQTTSLELSRDGRQLLAAGNDGAIRVHDLATYSSRTVAELGRSVRATFANDGRTIVAWTPDGITVIDVDRGTRRDLAAAPIALRADGRTLWWITADGRAWRSTIDAPTPARVEIPDDIRALEVAGGNVAFAGAHALWVVREGAPRQLAQGAARALAWSPDGRLGAIVDSRVIEVDAANAVTGETEQPDAQSLAWQGGALYVGGYGTVMRRGVQPGTRVDEGQIDALFAGPRGTLLARVDAAALKLIDGDLAIDLPSPSPIGATATGSASHFVVAGSDRVVLAWDVDPLLPRRAVLPAPVVECVHDGTRYLVSHADASATSLEALTGATRSLQLTGALFDARFSGDGSRVIVVDDHTRATIYGAQAIALGEAAAAVFVAPDRVVYTTPNGSVHLRDDTGDAVLFDHPAAGPIVVDTRDDWVLVLFADFSLWRYSVATGSSSQLPGGPHRYVLLLDRGDVAIADRAHLVVWGGDGSTTEISSLPPPITWLFRAPSGRLLAMTRGDAGYLVELAASHRATRALPAGSKSTDLTAAGSFAAYADVDGQLRVADLSTASTWRLGRFAPTTLRGPSLSPDGTRIFAVDRTSLLEWSQPVPEGAVETARLLDDLTNARLEAGALAW